MQLTYSCDKQYYQIVFFYKCTCLKVCTWMEFIPIYFTTIIICSLGLPKLTLINIYFNIFFTLGKTYIIS